MSKSTKLMLASCLILLVTTAISTAGSNINGWVMDDFESYSSTADLKATGLMTGGPWWILQELEYALFGKPIPSGAILEINLATGDPNGFTAIGEVDADGPQGVQVHYKLTDSDSSCDLFTMVHNLGIPFSLIPTGEDPPLDYLPVADMTTIDKITMKVKKYANNKSNTDSFALVLLGPDIKVIGSFPVVSTSPPNEFLEYPNNIWETVEFDINGEMDISMTESAFGRDMVSAILIGTYDTSGSDVTYLLDDITLYNEGDPCHAYSPADINMDCAVNMLDMAQLAAQWLSL